MTSTTNTPSTTTTTTNTNTLLASCSDSSVQLWDAISFTSFRKFNPHTAPIRALSWSLNNQVIATASGDGQIAINHNSGANLFTLPSTNTPINSVCLSSSSRNLAAGDEKGNVFISDLKKREIVKLFSTEDGEAVNTVQFNSSDTYLAAASASGEIIFYNVGMNQPVAKFPSVDSCGVRDLKFSPFKKNILASCGEDGSVYVWDTNTRKPYAAFPHQHNAPCSGVNFSPVNHLLLASAGLDCKILFFDVAEKKVVKVLNTEFPLTCISFKDDGVTLAAGTSQGRVLVFDLRSGSTPLQVLKVHEPEPIVSVQFQHAKSLASTPSHTTGPPSTPSHTPGPAYIPTTPAYAPVAPPGRLPVPTLSTQLRPAQAQLLKNEVSEFGIFSPLKTKPPQAFTPSNISSLPTVTTNVKENYPTPTTSNITRLEGENRELIHKAQKAIGIPASLTSQTTIPPPPEYTAPSIESPQITPSQFTKNDLPFLPISSTPQLPPSYTPLSSSSPLLYETTPTFVTLPSPLSSSSPPLFNPNLVNTLPPQGPSSSSSSSSSSSYPHATNISNNISEIQQSSAPQPHLLQQQQNRHVMGDVVMYGDVDVAQLQQKLMRSVIEDALDSFRASVRQDVQNLHLELIRQFQIQQEEITRTLANYVYNSRQSLLEEIEVLKKENQKLRQQTFY